MNTICTDKFCKDRARLELYLKKILKPSRYTHSLGVEDMAGRLALKYGADIDKAKFAGRFHDIAKCFDSETMNEYIKKYDLSESLIDDNALAHSKVGAAILENEFGVIDEEILNSVKSHTTGRYGMSLLEEIVYVADAIEDNRSYDGLKELQEKALTNLDESCLFIMDFTLERIESRHRIPDEDTIQAREFIIDRLSKNKTTEKEN